jgi:hypothetical protein
VSAIYVVVTEHMDAEHVEKFDRSISPEGVAEWEAAHRTPEGLILDPAAVALIRQMEQFAGVGE